LAAKCGTKKQKLGAKLNVERTVRVSSGKVIERPECGRIEWLARALSMGQAERESVGEGGV
jgi:hypothetical protein